jgi:hypothetical protein
MAENEAKPTTTVEVRACPGVEQCPDAATSHEHYTYITVCQCGGSRQVDQAR